MKKLKILFVCIHNSARSQMAEAFVNHLAGDRFEAQSAGLEPGKLNPFVVVVMKETGIDISAQKTKGVKEFIDRKEIFDYVITVCDESNAEKCPVFPGPGERLHWGFEDPSTSGTPDQRLAHTRQVRDQIQFQVQAWTKKTTA